MLTRSKLNDRPTNGRRARTASQSDAGKP